MTLDSLQGFFWSTTLNLFCSSCHANRKTGFQRVNGRSTPKLPCTSCFNQMGFLTAPLACLLPPVFPTPSKVVLEVMSSIPWIPASAWHSEISVHAPADATCWLSGSTRSPPLDTAGSTTGSPWSQAWYLQYNRWSRSLDWWMLKRCLRNPISCPLWFSDCIKKKKKVHIKNWSKCLTPE